MYKKKKMRLSLNLAVAFLIATAINQLFIKTTNESKPFMAEIKSKDNLKFNKKNEYDEFLINTELYRKEQEKIKAEQEKFKKEQELEKLNNSKINISRGGVNYVQVKEVTCIVTYYTNQNNRMEGGQLDKQGKRLTSHREKIIATPSDIPYGSYIVLDGMGSYKSVDTGQLITWQNKEKTIMKVDIFVPNATQKQLNKLGKKTVKGWVYYVEK